MWIRIDCLRRLGFRPGERGYWWCERGHGLPPHSHLSIYAWGAKSMRRGDEPRAVEVNAFHVTFAHRGNNLHFYYHDRGECEWEPGGHTSAGELRALGCEPAAVRAAADGAAERFITALGGTLQPRWRG
jgi:hypothetical protein